MSIVFGIIVFIGVLIAVGAFFGVFFLVDQNTVKIVETFRKFTRVAYPGLNFKIPYIQSASSAFTLQVQKLAIEVETKTKDNVFVLINIVVQYGVNGGNVNGIIDAYYRLIDADNQLTAYVSDAVRSSVPDATLDVFFLQKDAIADAVRGRIDDRFTEFGYKIYAVLVVDIRPDKQVQDAMNEINAQARLREAALEKAEADKMILIKAAEGQSESKRLQGEGVAAERLAIVKGLKESFEGLEQALGDDAKTILMMTQYFDTMREVGKNAKAIFLPASPGGVSSLTSEIRAAVISADEVKA